MVPDARRAAASFARRSSRFERLARGHPDERTGISELHESESLANVWAIAMSRQSVHRALANEIARVSREQQQPADRGWISPSEILGDAR
jgi:hypothetical protein